MIDLRAGSEGGKLRRDIHAQGVVGPQRQYPGKSHGARPTGNSALLRTTRFLDPSPQNAPALLIHHALHSVVRSMVEQAPGLSVETEVTLIKSANFPIDLPLGGVEQHMFTGERKEVRAFPHFTRVNGIDLRALVPLA